jgi:hypothetical protein
VTAVTKQWEERDFRENKNLYSWPLSGDKDEIILSKELGLFVEQRGQKTELKFIYGDVPKSLTFAVSPYIMMIWNKLVSHQKLINKMKAQIAQKDDGTLKTERKRVAKLLTRASKEFALHQETLMVAMEISNNPDAERILFGSNVVD